MMQPDPLLIEFRRLATVRPGTRNEVLAALDECLRLKRRLQTVRDALREESRLFERSQRAARAYDNYRRPKR